MDSATATFVCKYCTDTGVIRVPCGGSYGQDVTEPCEDCAWLASRRADWEKRGPAAALIQPLAPEIVSLLNSKPVVDAARVAKASRRARGVDTYASEMSGAEIMFSEKVRDSILSHRPDPAYLEDLWDAVTAALGAEGGMKLTVAELVQQVADKRAVMATAQGVLPSTG